VSSEPFFSISRSKFALRIALQNEPKTAHFGESDKFRFEFTLREFKRELCTVSFDFVLKICAQDPFGYVQTFSIVLDDSVCVIVPLKIPILMLNIGCSRHGTAPTRCLHCINTVVHGTNTVAHGTNTVVHGTNTVAHGTNTHQHGSAQHERMVSTQQYHIANTPDMANSDVEIKFCLDVQLLTQHVACYHCSSIHAFI
jgi:hypothetical protein